MKSYYAQVKDFVSPRLLFYKDDLTVLDKATLSGYSGEFIHCSRDSGTDLSLLSDISDQKKLAGDYIFCMRSTNNLFLHGHNGIVKEITREKAQKLFEATAKVACAKWTHSIATDDKSRDVLYKRELKNFMDAVKEG